MINICTKPNIHGIKVTFNSKKTTNDLSVTKLREVTGYL